MPFWVVSEVGGRMGVLYGWRSSKGKGIFGEGRCGASHCNHWDSLREGRRRGCSQITLGFLVLFHDVKIVAVALFSG